MSFSLLMLINFSIRFSYAEENDENGKKITTTNIEKEKTHLLILLPL